MSLKALFLGDGEPSAEEKKKLKHKKKREAKKRHRSGDVAVIELPFPAYSSYLRAVFHTDKPCRESVELMDASL